MTRPNAPDLIGRYAQARPARPMSKEHLIVEAEREIMVAGYSAPCALAAREHGRDGRVALDPPHCDSDGTGCLCPCHDLQIRDDT